MTTSTAPAATYTAAPAALLRGGDRNTKQHLSAAPTGRPVQSNGSGIKSHCPAGAGIIKPVSSTRETANTPAQGVRHAAEPSTPLRSGDGAAAQLVDGYKRLWHLRIQPFGMKLNIIENCIRHFLPLSAALPRNLIQLPNLQSCGGLNLAWENRLGHSDMSFDLNKSTCHIITVYPHRIYHGEVGRGGSEQPVVVIQHDVRNVCSSAQVTYSLLNHGKPIACNRQRLIHVSNRVTNLSQALLRLQFSTMPSFVLREKDSNNNSEHTSKRLNPSRRPIRAQDKKQTNNSRRTKQSQQNDIPIAESKGQLLIQDVTQSHFVFCSLPKSTRLTKFALSVYASKAGDIPTTPGTSFAGGFYAGCIQIAGDVYALIVSPRDTGEIHDAEWGEYGKAAEAHSYCDGLANTRAMAAGGSELAKHILSLQIGEHSDWYLPSRDELELCYRNLKPTNTPNDCAYRDGDNPSSLPPGLPYNQVAPAQAAEPRFQAGNAEAFAADRYWTSTEQDRDAALQQEFSYGMQCDDIKHYPACARAVRRIKLSLAQPGGDL
ncbi:MAG: hypothetical protein VYD45_14370 [Pseudomonadota bacterium]|nr:hypothetical protein [Pseudomonadota bacterium]